MTSNPAPLEPVEASDPSHRGAADPATPADATAPAADRSVLRWLLPLAALAIGAGLYALLYYTREAPVTRDPVPTSPLVRVMTATPQDLQLFVEARGTVLPRTESDLVAEVRGRVVSVSPRLEVGGFFSQGDELLRLDAREHRIALDRARAMVQLRRSEARLADADADRARQLRRGGASSAAELEQIESRALVARAFLAEADASVDQEELDLERTVVRAPFDGRVRERSVDVGQFVSPGQKLGRLFAVDYAEVRLPIRTDELAYLASGLDTAVQGAAIEGAEVELTGRLGGVDLTWPARLARAEASIDEQTRMFNVVARVEDPYAIRDALSAPETGPTDGTETPDGEQGEVVAEPVPVPRVLLPNEPATAARIPLPTGLFVTAQIAGRTLEDVFVVPPLALRDGSRVFVVEPSPEREAPVVADAGDEMGGAVTDRAWAKEGVLRVRDVSVAQRDRDRVVIDDGLEAGDVVIVSPLRVHSDGMAVRVVEADPR